MVLPMPPQAQPDASAQIKKWKTTLVIILILLAVCAPLEIFLTFSLADNGFDYFFGVLLTFCILMQVWDGYDGIKRNKYDKIKFWGLVYSLMMMVMCLLTAGKNLALNIPGKQPSNFKGISNNVCGPAFWVSAVTDIVCFIVVFVMRKEVKKANPVLPETQGLFGGLRFFVKLFPTSDTILNFASSEFPNIHCASNCV